jgi:hypothetical protein
MAHKNDWLPGRRERQLAMAKNWNEVMNVSGKGWDIPKQVCPDLELLVKNAENALSKTGRGTHTATDTARCEEAFSALVEKMRDIKKRYFLTPPLTDPDYVSLSLDPPDKVRTVIPPPTAQVEADLTFPGIHLVELKQIRPVAGGNPPDERSDYGVRIFWGFGGPGEGPHKFRVTAPPQTGSDMPYSTFTRKKKELFDFEGESGNLVYFCLRYENPSGGEGPFGPVMKAYIP